MQPTDLHQITVIIVTYNSAHCVRQLASNLVNFPHIILVDNASRDDIALAQQECLPQAKLICLKTNRGFGAANNVALLQTQTPFALLVNPDCSITAQAALQLLRTAEEFPLAAIVAPQVLRPNGSLEISYRWPARYWQSKGAQAQALCCVGFVTGAAMLLRVCIFRGIGFFDEDFFLYYEDDDLCMRVFDAKHNILLEPRATAIHAARQSVKEGFPWRSEYIRGFHHAQSKLIFESKHGRKERVSAYRAQLFMLALLSIPLRILWPQPRYAVRLWGRVIGLLTWSGSVKRQVNK